MERAGAGRAECAFRRAATVTTHGKGEMKSTTSEPQRPGHGVSRKVATRISGHQTNAI
jgi:hypothetical protein